MQTTVASRFEHATQVRIPMGATGATRVDVRSLLRRVLFLAVREHDRFVVRRVVEHLSEVSAFASVVLNNEVAGSPAFFFEQWEE